MDSHQPKSEIEQKSLTTLENGLPLGSWDGRNVFLRDRLTGGRTQAALGAADW